MITIFKLKAFFDFIVETDCKEEPIWETKYYNGEDDIMHEVD